MKKLPNGTRSIKLTGQEICDIIRTAKDANLICMKYGSLKLYFKDMEKVNPILPQPISEAAEQIPKYIDNQEVDISPFSEEDRREILEEMRKVQLMTEDPSAYEQEMIDSQINGVEYG